jgi:hypothetical protein
LASGLLYSLPSFPAYNVGGFTAADAAISYHDQILGLNASLGLWSCTIRLSDNPSPPATRLRSRFPSIRQVRGDAKQLGRQISDPLTFGIALAAQSIPVLPELFGQRLCLGNLTLEGDHVF